MINWEILGKWKIDWNICEAKNGNGQAQWKEVHVGRNPVEDGIIEYMNIIGRHFPRLPMRYSSKDKKQKGLTNGRREAYGAQIY
jgi:hypothetical protein